MSSIAFQYEFIPSVSIVEVERSLLLAVLGVECLHGETQTRLDASHALDAPHRACVIDASTDVGRDLNRLFAGFLRREFGADSFTVARVDSESTLKRAQSCQTPHR